MIDPELLQQLDIQTREMAACSRSLNEFNEPAWIKACETAIELAYKHPESVMEVFENETDARFISMANHLDDLRFLTDGDYIRVIRLAQRRSNPEVFSEVKRNLGCDFDRLYKLSLEA